MAAPTRQKKNVEAILTLKGPGASAAEATTGIIAAGEIADDIETNRQLAGLLATLRGELQSAIGDKTRREELMARLTALVANRG